MRKVQVSISQFEVILAFLVFFFSVHLNISLYRLELVNLLLFFMVLWDSKNFCLFTYFFITFGSLETIDEPSFGGSQNLNVSLLLWCMVYIPYK